MPNFIPIPHDDSHTTMQPASPTDLQNQFHDRVEDILNRYPIGYKQALEILMIAGILADEGIYLERLVLTYLSPIHGIDIIEKLRAAGYE